MLRLDFTSVGLLISKRNQSLGKVSKNPISGQYPASTKRYLTTTQGTVFDSRTALRRRLLPISCRRRERQTEKNKNERIKVQNIESLFDRTDNFQYVASAASVAGLGVLGSTTEGAGKRVVRVK